MKIKRKIVFLAVVLLSIGAVWPLPAKAQFSGWQNRAVRVYARRDAVGVGEGFNVGVYRADRGEFGTFLRNDTASSVNVSRGFRVRLCESEGPNGEGGGRCEEYGQGIHNLRYENTASYIQVWRENETPGGGNEGEYDRTPLIVYEGKDSRGRSQTFSTGVFRSDRNELGNLRNDHASSIAVGRGYRVRLCENEGANGHGEGRCEEYAEGSFNLRYQDTASFIQVRRANERGGWWRDELPVILYQGRGETGVQQGYEVGIYRSDLGTLGAVGNDQASSVFIAAGYRARICENENGGRGGGRCEEYGPGRYDLRYPNRASFINVWKVF